MAITLTISPSGDDPETEIEDTSRTLRIVNATITAASDDVMEIIESVTATIEENEPGVIITGGTMSVSIVGTYVDPFEDSFTYVERGSSNLIEEPKIVIGVENMPSNKDFYNLTQDTREESIRHYRVTVITDLATQQFLVTHAIYNEWEGMRSFVANYYD